MFYSHELDSEQTRDIAEYVGYRAGKELCRLSIDDEVMSVLVDGHRMTYEEARRFLAELYRQMDGAIQDVVRRYARVHTHAPYEKGGKPK